MIESAVHVLAGQVDPARLRRDVDVLAACPRSRMRAPEAMAEAERHVTDELSAAGWQVERQPFDLRWQPGTTDRQGHRLLPLKLRLHRRLTGANLLARLPGHPQRPTVLIGAHLDSVDGSPGAAARHPHVLRHGGTGADRLAVRRPAVHRPAWAGGGHDLS
jgi:acetylornithine deacetylase/succinyl-diaminopimelate desuccinylase-like protein